MKTASQARDTFLYRLYNSAGELLYVGITNNPPRRLREHKAQWGWARDIAHIRMLGPLPRSIAADLERQALGTEHPLFGDTPARRSARGRAAASCRQQYAQLRRDGHDMTSAVRLAVEAVYGPGATA